MLSVYFGEMENSIYDTSMYFNNAYKDNWIIDKLSVEMIKDIDKSDVIDCNTIKSKALGKNIIPTELSGGVKTLILIRFDKNNIFNASTCGDNCAKWILKIAEKQKVVINLRHIMNFGKNQFKICILNNKKIVKNMQEFLDEGVNFLHGDNV